MAVRFYTRLPVPVFGFESEPLAADAFPRALRLAPLAGAILGLCGAAVLSLALALGLPRSFSVLLTLGTTIWLGGGLHEDGLADVADGFGGGRTRARKLEIMRDSTIGSYGTLAILLSVALRGLALAALVDRQGVGGAALAFVAAQAASRGFGLLPLALLPPARRDGLGAATAPGGDRATSRRHFVVGIGLALVCGLLVPLPGGVPAARSALACGLGLLASAAVTGLAARQIGGQTGDVAGAAQQGAEIAYLTGLLIVLQVPASALG